MDMLGIYLRVNYVDVDNDFEPKYITIRGKGPLLAELRKKLNPESLFSNGPWPWRRGYIMASFYSFKVRSDRYARITFNEITKDAVKNSINKREI